MAQLIASKRRWCVLVGAIVCQFVANWPFHLGVVYHELVVRFDEPKDFTALVASVAMGVSFMSGKGMRILLSKSIH